MPIPDEYNTRIANARTPEELDQIEQEILSVSGLAAGTNANLSTSLTSQQEIEDISYNERIANARTPEDLDQIENELLNVEPAAFRKHTRIREVPKTSIPEAISTGLKVDWETLIGIPQAIKALPEVGKAVGKSVGGLPTTEREKQIVGAVTDPEHIFPFWSYIAGGGPVGDKSINDVIKAEGLLGTMLDITFPLSIAAGAAKITGKALKTVGAVKASERAAKIATAITPGNLARTIVEKGPMAPVLSRLGVAGSGRAGKVAMGRQQNVTRAEQKQWFDKAAQLSAHVEALTPEHKANLYRYLEHPLDLSPGAMPSPRDAALLAAGSVVLVPHDPAVRAAIAAARDFSTTAQKMFDFSERAKDVELARSLQRGGLDMGLIYEVAEDGLPTGRILDFSEDAVNAFKTNKHIDTLSEGGKVIVDAIEQRVVPGGRTATVRLEKQAEEVALRAAARAMVKEGLGLRVKAASKAERIKPTMSLSSQPEMASIDDLKAITGSANGRIVDPVFFPHRPRGSWSDVFGTQVSLARGMGGQVRRRTPWFGKMRTTATREYETDVAKAFKEYAGEIAQTRNTDRFLRGLVDTPHARRLEHVEDLTISPNERLFSPDLYSSLAKYESSTVKWITGELRNVKIDDLLSDLSKPERYESTMNRLADYMSKHGDTPEKIDKSLKDAKWYAVDKDFFENYMSIPLGRSGVGRELETIAGRLILDNTNSVFKVAVLATPRFIINNVFGNAVLTAMKMGLNPLRYAEALQARKVLKAEQLIPTELGAGVMREFSHQIHPGIVKDKFPLLYKIQSDVWGSKYNPVKHMTDFIFDVNTKIGEDFWRELKYSDAMVRQYRERSTSLSRSADNIADGMREISAGYEKGVTMPSAMKAAVAETEYFLGAYSAMGPIERQILKRVVPFYSWLRHITETTLKLDVDYPGRTELLHELTQIGMGLDGEDKPEWMRDSIDITNLIGAEQEGNRALISTRGINPFADVSLQATGLTPLYGLAVSQLQGRDPMTGRPYELTPSETGESRTRPSFFWDVTRLLLPPVEQYGQPAVMAALGRPTGPFERGEFGKLRVSQKLRSTVLSAKVAPNSNDPIWASMNEAQRKAYMNYIDMQRRILADPIVQATISAWRIESHRASVEGRSPLPIPKSLNVMEMLSNEDQTALESSFIKEEVPGLELLGRWFGVRFEQYDPGEERVRKEIRARAGAAEAEHAVGLSGEFVAPGYNLRATEEYDIAKRTMTYLIGQQKAGGMTDTASNALNKLRSREVMTDEEYATLVPYLRVAVKSVERGK